MERHMRRYVYTWMQDLSHSAERSKESGATSRHDVVPEEIFFGTSPAMQSLRTRIDRVASTDVPILIQGESGTGKDLLANLVHDLSPWRAGRFVKVSCPAIPAGLLESELFGYDKGAFTDAKEAKPGWVELADGGTLFLDELSEFDIALQAKLLQLLQDGYFARIGGQSYQRANVRIICASHHRLEEHVRAGRFREDLFYRVNVVTLRLPPLRERKQDIPILSQYFLQLYSAKYGRRLPSLTPALVRRLCLHDWPGNIRELENLVKTYVVLEADETILDDILQGARPFPADATPDGNSVSLKSMTREAVREVERKVILDALQSNNWNRKKAARQLNISYRSLFYKLRGAGIPSKRSLPISSPPGDLERE
jgi:two-component system response regulator AtoC